MSLLWGWKQRGLCRYILTCADNEDAWEFTEHRGIHRCSGVEIWMSNGFWSVDIYDWRDSNNGAQKVGFSLMQRWRIHRKLKKIKQKMDRAIQMSKREGFESKHEYYLAKMVGSTWAKDGKK